MKKTLLTIPLMLIHLIVDAQSKIKVGVNYNFGASTYYGNAMSSMDASGSEMQKYSLKLSRKHPSPSRS